VKFFTWFDLVVGDRYYLHVLPVPTMAGFVLIVAVLAVGYFAVRKFI
jgi:hypothetical protein